jgi:hypothetical protein
MRQVVVDDTITYIPLYLCMMSTMMSSPVIFACAYLIATELLDRFSWNLVCVFYHWRLLQTHIFPFRMLGNTSATEAEAKMWGGRMILHYDARCHCPWCSEMDCASQIHTPQAKLQYYTDVLWQIQKHVSWKYAEEWCNRDWLVHHENMAAYTTVSAQWFIALFPQPHTVCTLLPVTSCFWRWNWSLVDRDLMMFRRFIKFAAVT